MWKICWSKRHSKWCRSFSFPAKEKLLSPSKEKNKENKSILATKASTFNKIFIFVIFSSSSSWAALLLFAFGVFRRTSMLIFFIFSAKAKKSLYRRTNRLFLIVSTQFFSSTHTISPLLEVFHWKKLEASIAESSSENKNHMKTSSIHERTQYLSICRMICIDFTRADQRGKSSICSLSCQMVEMNTPKSRKS